MTMPAMQDSYSSRVFVVQEPLRHSAAVGGVRPLFDLAPANKFGEIVICLDWSDTRHGFECDDLLWKLREALQGFDDDDYLLMTGNPTAMALAALVASEINDGRIRLLVWTKEGPHSGHYRVADIDLNAQPIT